MRKLFLFSLVTLTFQLAFGQYDPEALKVLDAMSSKYQKMGAFKADYTYNLTNEAAGLNESASGSLTIKGDKYFLNAGDQEVISDGELLWTYLAEVNELTIAYPEEDAFTPNKVFNAYKSGYKYRIKEKKSDGAYVIELEPEGLATMDASERENAINKVKLDITAKYDLTNFSIVMGNGSTFSYIIKNAVAKPEITDSFFKFDGLAHPKADTVDFR